MRAVLDTNVIVSATLIHVGNEDQILRAWQRGAFEVVISPEILAEIGRALFYEKLREFRWMIGEQIAELLQTLAQGSILVPGRADIKASRDPDDDKLLVAAVEADARFVVTGDRDLLDLGNYRGVRIVRPGVFLRVVRDQNRGQ